MAKQSGSTKTSTSRNPKGLSNNATGGGNSRQSVRADVDALASVRGGVRMYEQANPAYRNFSNTFEREEGSTTDTRTSTYGGNIISITRDNGTYLHITEANGSQHSQSWDTWNDDKAMIYAYEYLRRRR